MKAAECGIKSKVFRAGSHQERSDECVEDAMEKSRRTEDGANPRSAGEVRRGG